MTEKTPNIKKTSVYLPPELHVTIHKRAEVHRRSFNQELLWLIEQGLLSEQKSAYVSASNTCAQVGTGEKSPVDFCSKGLRIV